jgi:hypothetical protein
MIAVRKARLDWMIWLAIGALFMSQECRDALENHRPVGWEMAP